jgi:acyl-ACP thioesterase
VTGDGHVCTLPFRVRFDEAGPDGLVRTSTLLRYAQDLAGYHSAERGFDRTWYAHRGLTWLARAAAVAVLAPIAHGSSLTGSTWVVGERRVWARRRTEFRDDAGTLIAWAHVDWVLLDARGAPTRIPPEFEGAFGTPKATFPLGRVDLEAAPTDAVTATFTVRPQELDPMDHVNNAVYADWLDESVIAAGHLPAVRAIPRLVQLDYARSADAAAAIVGRAWPSDGGWAYRLADSGGTELLRARLSPIAEPTDRDGSAD